LCRQYATVALHHDGLRRVWYFDKVAAKAYFPHHDEQKEQAMNVTLKKMLAVFGVLLLAGGIAACEDKGPAEKAGESVDESMENAGDNIEQMGDDIKDSAEDATN
jgi:predicted small lipoprotein YifL